MNNKSLLKLAEDLVNLSCLQQVGCGAIELLALFSKMKIGQRSVITLSWWVQMWSYTNILFTVLMSEIHQLNASTTHYWHSIGKHIKAGTYFPHLLQSHTCTWFHFVVQLRVCVRRAFRHIALFCQSSTPFGSLWMPFKTNYVHVDCSLNTTSL